MPSAYSSDSTVWQNFLLVQKEAQHLEAFQAVAGKGEVMTGLEGRHTTS